MPVSVNALECFFDETFCCLLFSIKAWILPLSSVARLAVDINPDGRSYASGAEDGYVRLHMFDKDYLDMKDPVPEEDDVEDVGGIENEGDNNNN